MFYYSKHHDAQHEDRGKKENQSEREREKKKKKKKKKEKNSHFLQTPNLTHLEKRKKTHKAI